MSKATRKQPRSTKPAKSAGATLSAKSSQPARNVATAASAKAPKHAEPTQPANSLTTLTARVERLERKINSNERFARTFVRSVLSQTAATEAIQDVIRHSFREDAAAHGCRFGSHGWGLSIIRGIAERHGGTFDVSHVVSSGDGPKFIARVVVPCPAQSVMT